MKNRVTGTFTIAAAIIIAAVVHGLIVRDTGRYQNIGGGEWRIDTRTGAVFNINGDKMRNAL